MSLTTGLALALLIVVAGAGGLTAFAIHLKNRDDSVNKQGNHLNHA